MKLRVILAILVCGWLFQTYLHDHATFTDPEREQPSHSKNSPLVPLSSELEAPNKQEKDPAVPSHKNINFLIIGTDQRNDEQARADVLMVGNYDSFKRSLKIISIMRDSYVPIPRVGLSKINHAYYWGGAEMLKTTIEKNFQLSIDYVVTINFQGFIHLMDVLIPEGLEVNVTSEMISYYQWDKSPGVQTLHGKELLEYVRFRKDGQSDFGRVERQQEVFLQIFQVVKDEIITKKNVPLLLQLVRKCTHYVETDASFVELVQLGLTFLSNPIETVETLRIPVPNSYQNKRTASAGLVLDFDLEENLQAIRLFLHGQESLSLSDH